VNLKVIFISPNRFILPFFTLHLVVPIFHKIEPICGFIFFVNVGIYTETLLLDEVKDLAYPHLAEVLKQRVLLEEDNLLEDLLLN
jgi:hypothetical protein